MLNSLGLFSSGFLFFVLVSVFCFWCNGGVVKLFSLLLQLTSLSGRIH